MYDLRMPEIEVDVDKRLLLVDKRRCHLSPTELQIFGHLVKYRGMYQSKEQICMELWGDCSYQRTEDVRRHILKIRNIVGNCCISSRYGYGWIYDKACLDNPLAKVGGKDISGIMILPAAGRLFRRVMVEEEENIVDILDELDYGQSSRLVETLEELVIYPNSMPILDHLMCNAGYVVPAKELKALVWPDKEDWEDNLGEVIRNIRKGIEQNWRLPQLLMTVGETSKKVEGYCFVSDDPDLLVHLDGEFKFYQPNKKG